ncbi:MAG: CDP-alcohol phosphatidyltransferase family protein [Elusimicrobiota bacterium]
MTTATKITLMRIALTPVILGALVMGHSRLATAALLVAATSDLLDGAWARAKGQVTDAGALWDCVADKILLMSCTALLASLALIPLWFAVPLLSRDAALVLLWKTASHHGKALPMRPNLAGKSAATILMLYVLAILTYGNHASLGAIADYATVLMLTLSTYSFIQYILPMPWQATDTPTTEVIP